MSRAERRHRAEKAKARARRMLVEVWGWPRSEDELPTLPPHVSCSGPPERWYASPSAVARFARTRKPCSCAMCGNPRAIEGPPMSERRKLAAKALRQRIDLVGTHGHQPPFG